MTDLDTLDPCRAKALELVAGCTVNLANIEQDAEMLRRAINKGDHVNDEAADFLYDRHTVLQWVIAEAPARSMRDMAVKVRLWQRSIESGTAVWDDRWTPAFFPDLFPDADRAEPGGGAPHP